MPKLKPPKLVKHKVSTSKLKVGTCWRIPANKDWHEVFYLITKASLQDYGTTFPPQANVLVHEAKGRPSNKVKKLFGYEDIGVVMSRVKHAEPFSVEKFNLMWFSVMSNG